jgi:hypothetical protein
MSITPTAAGSPPTIDFGKCFRYFFEDPDWLKKALIGGLFTLLSLLIVGMFFVAGYWARLLKRVEAGEERPLPEWDDLGGIFGDGLKLVGLYFVYNLGLALLVSIPAGLIFGLLVAMGSVARRESGDAESAIAALGGLGITGLYAVFLILVLALSLYLPAAFVRVALKNDFAAGFAFRDNFAFIKANLGNYVLSLVFYLLTSFLAQFGVILCCVGVFPIAFWGYCVLGFALGETVRLNPGSV